MENLENLSTDKIDSNCNETFDKIDSNCNKTFDKIDLNCNETTDKIDSNCNETTDKSTEEESTNKSTINSNDNLNNQQSKRKSDNSLVFEQSKRKSINNLIFEDELMLKLDWNSRNELIKLLNEYTKLLVCGKKIPINKKKSIEENKTDLIKILTQSPFKLDKKPKENSYKIFINLDNMLKYQIINQLVKNENFIIYCKDKIDTNLKNELIHSNNYLITKLVNLPVEFIDNGAKDLIDEELNTNQLQFEDKKLVNKLEIEQLDSYHTIHSNKSTTLYCLKKDIKKFFENDNNFSSKPIEFLNIKWFINIGSKYDDVDKKKYLEFFLHVRNEIDDGNNVKWKCKTSYELILKSNKEDKTRELDYTFEKSLGYGNPKFLSEDELFNNGYIKDDSIKLEVKLTVDKIEKIF